MTPKPDTIVHVKEKDGSFKEFDITKQLEKFSLKSLPVETHLIVHEFTEDEMKSKSQQLAETCSKRRADEDSKKQVMSEFKAKIDAHTATINLLTQHIMSGEENRTENVYVLKDFDKGDKIFLSISAKKEVGRTKLSESDYQETLQLEIPDGEPTLFESENLPADHFDDTDEDEK